MVNLDFEKLVEERKKEYGAHLEARARCEESLNVGGGHLGKQISLNSVNCADWRREYRCSSCGWIYSIKMTPSEVREYKKEMNKIVVR